MPGKRPTKTETRIETAGDTPVEITEVRKLRRASASIRGGVIAITVPMRWTKKDKLDAIQSLITRLLRKKTQDEAILNRPDLGPRITIRTVAELAVYVRRINAETFNVPLAKIRMGNSRYTQLAQMNMKTRTMTVSRYCLNNVPESALRYLIVHELAHLLEASHNQRFWMLVGRFVPDYKKQSRFIKAFHHLAVEQDDLPDAPDTEESTPRETTPVAPPVKAAMPIMQQLQLALFGR